LRRIVYNFVRLHMSLNGLTPSECAEIDLDLGRNRLLDLIKIFFALFDGAFMKLNFWENFSMSFVFLKNDLYVVRKGY
jgi:hypothetical protein